MSEKPRSAGVRQPDRLLSGLDSAGIAQAARSEISSTARLYRKEWVFESRHASPEIAVAYFDEKFGGRLEPEDARFASDAASTMIQVRRWNVVAECKSMEIAEALMAAFVADGANEASMQVVQRNSRLEHQLGLYGVLKLVSK